MHTLHHDGPRMRRGAAVLLVLFASACVRTRDIAALPTIEGGSLLLYVIDKGSPPRPPFFYAVDTSTAVSLNLTFPRTFTAYALNYSCSLETLEIPLGYALPAASGTDGRPLPGTKTIYELHSSDDGTSPWTPSVTVPDELLQVQLAQPNASSPCAAFSSVDVQIPHSSRNGIGYVIALDEHSAMAVSARDELYLVRDDGAPAELYQTITSTTPFAAAFRAADGQVWLFGPSGLLAHGDFEHGFTPAARSTTRLGEVAAWIDATPDEAPFELFAVTDFATFERFDGTNGTWSLIKNGGHFIREKGAVLRLGPGEALAVGPDEHGIVHYLNGVTNVETPASFQPNVEASALGFAPGIGALVGSTVGTLDVRQDGNWSRIPGPEDGSMIKSIVPFEDGFVFGVQVPAGSAGFIYQYVPSSGLCSPQMVTPAEIIRIAPIANGLLAVSRESDDGWVSFLRKKPNYPECEHLGTLLDVNNAN